MTMTTDDDDDDDDVRTYVDDDDDDEVSGRQGGGARRGTKILVSRGRVSYPCPHSGPSWSSGASRGVDKTSIACFSVCLSPNRRAHCLRLINLCTDGGDVVFKVWFLLQRPARPPQRFPAGARTTEGGSFLKAGLTFEIFSRFAPMQFQHAQQSQGWKACFFVRLFQKEAIAQECRFSRASTSNWAAATPDGGRRASSKQGTR